MNDGVCQFSASDPNSEENIPLFLSNKNKITKIKNTVRYLFV